MSNETPADAHWRKLFAERAAQRANNRTSAESRRRARSAGEPTYIAAAPCKYGHEPVRHTNSGLCVTCASKKEHQNHREMAYQAGPIAFHEAKRAGMRYYYPLLEEAIRDCEEPKFDRPAHRCLFRVGELRGRCTNCDTKRTRARKRSRRRPQRPDPLQPKIDTSFLDD